MHIDTLWLWYAYYCDMHYMQTSSRNLPLLHTCEASKTYTLWYNSIVTTNRTWSNRACITHGWKIVCDVVFTAHGWTNQTMWDVCTHQVKKKGNFVTFPNASGSSAWVDLTSMVIYYHWVRSLFDLPKGNGILAHNHLLVDESFQRGKGTYHTIWCHNLITNVTEIM
jgi:hypothetical protein